MNINDFVEYEQLRGIKNTASLHTHLKPLFAYLSERELKPEEAAVKDIQEFQTWLSTLVNDDGTLRYASYTIQSLMSISRRFYNYLKEQGSIISNPFLRIKHMKAERKLPHDIPNETKLDELLETLRTFWKHPHVRDRRLYYRCHVMAELMYASGLRISEVLALKHEDINFFTGTIQVKNGKGGKDRTAYITEYAAKVLRFYSDEMRNTVIVNKDSELLFGTKSTATVTATFHKVLKEEGSKKGISRFTSHSFRHSLGYHLLKRGCDLRYIQLILGHEDLNSTTIYTKVSKEELRTQLDTCHPRVFKEKMNERKSG